MFKREEIKDIRPTGEKSTTIIGTGTHFNGLLKVNGSLRIDGEVEGQIQVSDSVTVGPTGVLKAEVSAAVAVVAGRIKGRVWTKDRVVLEKGSRLEGDVQTRTFMIEDGAFFQGNCQMNEAEGARPAAGPKTPDQGKFKVVGG